MDAKLVRKRYTDACRLEGRTPDAALSRFAARYNVATATRGLRSSGLAAGSEAGYSAALRVTLAYSALEAFDAATGKRRRTAPVHDSKLATAFRSAALKRLRHLLQSKLSGDKLRASLERLSSTPSDVDVASVAAGVRHLFCHGDFSAYGAGAAQSKAVQGFLNQLADAVLQAAATAFEQYLDSNAIGPWKLKRAEHCPSCGVDVGARHVAGCTIALCKSHGEQWFSCMRNGKHSSTVYRGVFPGTVEALKRGWVSKGKGTQGAPDLNRVISELRWSPDVEMYV